MSKTAVMELNDVCKSYQSRQVLKSVSLRLEPGLFYALIGQNGAGKSTLMRILARHEAPDRGCGSILGESILKDSREHARRVAYVSESIDYVLPISARNFFEHYGSLFPDWQAGTFESVIRELGIDLNLAFRSYSRGQRMQIAFAAALAQRPKALLLDEITSVLDARARNLVMRLLGRYVQAGGTVLMATHIVTEVHPYAHRMILIEDGELKLDLPVEEIANRFLKLKRPRDYELDIFDHDECVLVGSLPDDSLAYLIPMSAVPPQSLPEEVFCDARITPEEAFIYFTHKKAG